MWGCKQALTLALMQYDPEHMIMLIERLHSARLIAEWENTPEGIKFKWNKEFRDGQGAEAALAVVHDVIVALETLPPLTALDIYKMCQLVTSCDEGDEGLGDA